MEDFKIKLDIYEELDEELDEYIWNIFNAYIEKKGILFSDPDNWSVGIDCIYFDGRDGCRGSYDRVSIIIPLEFFENPEEEFLKLKKERKK